MGGGAGLCDRREGTDPTVQCARNGERDGVAVSCGHGGVVTMADGVPLVDAAGP